MNAYIREHKGVWETDIFIGKTNLPSNFQFAWGVKGEYFWQGDVVYLFAISLNDATILSGE